MPISKKIVLGIDPGLASCGWGVVAMEGQKAKAISWGVISTKKNENFPQRLEKISQQVKKIIKKYQPELVSIEELFFCKNAKTAMLVGQARGVVILEAQIAKLPIIELTPLQAKQMICGYGKATKDQVQKILKIILGLKKIPHPDDAADALAIAIAGAGLKKDYDKFTNN